MRSAFWRRVLTVAALLLTLPVSAHAAPPDFDFRGNAGLLMDADTETVLAEKAIDERIPPASMSKLMTLYLAFDAVKAGVIALEDEISVSSNAFRKGGSTMFLKLGQRVTVIDILRGIVIQSGNDASIALAEALAGTEAAFAEQMTRRGREIGLRDSNFVNSTGWPAPEEYMTVRDIATVSLRIIRDHPEFLPLFAEKEFAFNGVNQGNRNPLLYGFVGADGLKTGHTEEAGYGLAATAKRGDRRLISVVSGLGSKRARGDESERLLNWGFRHFDNVTLFPAGRVVHRAPVWMGVTPMVGLATAGPVTITAPKTLIDSIEAAVVYESPAPAPISAGGSVGGARLEVSADGEMLAILPLIAQQDVARAGPVGRVMAVAEYYLFGPGL